MVISLASVRSMTLALSKLEKPLLIPKIRASKL
jgi:hypothetical protein